MVLLATLTLLQATALKPAELPALIPKPQSVATKPGSFQIDSQTVVLAPASTRAQAELVLAPLRRLTGSALPYSTTKPSKNYIEFQTKSDLAWLGSEGYRISVRPTYINLRAHQQSGLFNALQTLRQLLPNSLEDLSRSDEQISVQSVEISDSPRFKWRGLHLDVSRHFFTVDEVKSLLDSMAMFKLNVFHWHLVDDGGWRIEINKYPKLTQIGAWRNADSFKWDGSKIEFVPQSSDQDKYGGFYTQEQIRDVIAYAKLRNIEIVPEIEMPGHNLPAIWAYPELACDKEALEKFAPLSYTKKSNVMCPGKDSTFTFLENVLDEIRSLFPSKYIHIGADEVDRRVWDFCPSCQARVQSLGLKDDAQLQSYFVKRMAKHLDSKGKQLIGWDEILDGGLPSTAVVMSWRGVSGGIEAAKQGKDVIMCPTSHCYLDYPYNTTSTEQSYSYEPIPTEIPPQNRHHVLGGQGNLWTEWMEDFDRVETMAFPRAIALSEVFWSPANARSWPDFYTRLQAIEPRLDLLGVDYYLTPPLAETDFVLFKDQATVAFKPLRNSRNRIVFTTDGTTPNTKSPTYLGEVPITKDTVVTAAILTASGRISEPTIVRLKRFVPTTALNRTPGLKAEYFSGTFKSVKDMVDVPAYKSEFVSKIDISRSNREESFGVRYSGYLQLPKSGAYTFHLTSDDGSVLSLSSTVAIDHDGAHGPSTKVARLLLPAGVIPFQLDFFEIGGGQVLKLEVEGPGVPRQLIPDSWLFRPL